MDAPSGPAPDLMPDLLRAVIDNLPISVYTKDRQGRYVLNNARNLHLLGVATEAEVVGRTVFDFFPAEIAAAFADDDRRVLEGGQAVQREEPFVDPVTGRAGWFHTTKIPLRLPDGSIGGLVGVSRDITAQKLAERQDRQAQRLESLGALSAGIAHDFNNLLTVIFGSLALLRQNPAVAAAPSLEHIETAAAHAAHLTRQLLTFSRKQVVQPRLVSLEIELPQIHNLLERLMPETIAVDVGIEDAVWPIEIDPVQLSQVLFNLAINARDAMPRGGRLTLHVRNRVLGHADTLAPGDAHPGEYVEIAVADTGLGLSPQVKARLFEPFFTTKDEGQGTGLGLATSWSIVASAGGFIRAEGEEGRGATFRVLLPRSTDGGGALPRAEETPAVATTAGGTVLVVEDNDAVRAPLVEALTTQGYAVISAADGEQAMAAASALDAPIGFLVTDMMLPAVSGLDVARQVQQHHPDCHVLFVTGYLDLGLRNALPAGASLLQKPFSLRALVAELDQLRRRAGSSTTG